MPDLAILVPTRGRPGNIRKVISAWDFTDAWDHADLVLIVDADDPELAVYEAVADLVNEPAAEGTEPVEVVVMDEWMPMVHKLNLVAALYAQTKTYRALGFAGDDHLPQTIGWAQRYLTVLRELGSGMVYSDDGYQGRKLSTEWAVTADAVRALGRMVPAPVEHMYCDNSMMDLFGGAGALRFLPEVRIEHMHPVTGKAETDAQYQRVNHRDQFARDRRSYEGWRRLGMMTDIAAIRALRPGMPDVRPDRTVSRLSPGSVPRKVPLRPRGATVSRHLPYPRHFRNVQGATPDEIGMALADFASAVPADQEIVELGVYQGRTALMMGWGARNGHGAHVTAIDAWDLPGNTYGPPFNTDSSRRWAAHWIQSLGYANRITLVQGFASDMAARWVTSPDLIGRGNKPIGLLFVDDDHSYEGARGAIVAWAPHLAEGARIAVDDYGHPDWPGVAQAVDELVDEGFLEPIEIFHDRLAVTSIRATLANNPGATPRAITSEGVSPSPERTWNPGDGPVLPEADYPAAGDQVAVTVDLGAPSVVVPDEVDEMFAGPVGTEPGCSHPECILGHPHAGPAELARVDSDVSTDRRGRLVHDGELEGVAAYTLVDELTLPQLRALAKIRGIVLGIRKDKKAETIQAIKDGR